MAGHRDYDIDPLVFAQARAAGLIGNLETRLPRMARLSAPFNHAEGNRRFECFVLRIEQGVVKSIRRIDEDTGEVIHDVIGQLDERHRALKAVQKHLPVVPPAPKARTAGDILAEGRQRRVARRKQKAKPDT